MIFNRIQENLIDKYQDYKYKKQSELQISCVDLEPSNMINDEMEIDSYQYHEMDIFDDENPIEKLFNSKYYTDIVFTILGLSEIELKSSYITFEGIPTHKEQDISTISFTDKVELKDIKYLVKLKEYFLCNETYGIEDVKKDYNVGIKIKIDYINAELIAEFDFHNSDPNIRSIVEDDKTYFRCIVLAIVDEKNSKQNNGYIPTWKSEIIHSLSLYESGEYQQAFALLFASLDRFINNEYNDMYNFFSSLDIKNELLLYKIYVYHKIKKYKKIRANLLNFKLRNILIELGIDKKSINKTIKKLEKFKEYRNIIDHCLDGKGSSEEIKKRDSYDYKTNYKKLLYETLNSMIMMEYIDENIDDVINY